jgi:hypothetical protein
LYDIFGDKAPLSNNGGTGGNSNDLNKKDDQFFFQSQESYVTSDPQASQRNISAEPIQIIIGNQNAPNQGNVFGSLNQDELNELRKKKMNQKLIGMVGDFDAISMNHSETRKGATNSLNNTISDYTNLNLNLKPTVVLQQHHHNHHVFNR